LSHTTPKDALYEDEKRELESSFNLDNVLRALNSSTSAKELQKTNSSKPEQDSSNQTKPQSNFTIKVEPKSENSN
jgi:hypothetical protein